MLLNDCCSSSFAVSSGVRRGCPWAPSLFNVGIELLGDALRDLPLPGFHLGPLGRLYLDMYADNLGVFLTDPQHWPAVRRVIMDFGLASGLCLNENKTEAVLLHAAAGTRGQLLGLRHGSQLHRLSNLCLDLSTLVRWHARSQLMWCGVRRANWST